MTSMCVDRRISICTSNPLSHRLQCRSQIDPPTIPNGRPLAKSKQFSLSHSGHHPLRQSLQPPPRSAAENGGDANSHNCTPRVHQNASEKRREKPPTPTAEILQKLKRYGVSGILSYGLLNTAYYSTAFLLVWFYVSPSPGKMGYLAAAKRFVKIMAMVWAGSQVTKVARAGGALALAPVVDRGLCWFTAKFEFESQGKAFMAIVGLCLGLALAMFLVVTLLWA
ncbi:Uncharacterized protein CEY00_Acc02433 [Actinidia chinensis var. chinensis]|uniref:Uncharacterized protein n=1 Tax=Actinidia chinensis var. chinensis TaxID=1590841 RepID=A0A2R6RZ04_ACTCC|nr:Uncharacterized protein CEY00_Acc02433 [Actinidia chinensis var. chinensis]